MRVQMRSDHSRCCQVMLHGYKLDAQVQNAPGKRTSCSVPGEPMPANMGSSFR